MDLMLNFLKTWLTVTTWLTVATWRKTKPVRMIDGSHKSRCLLRRIPLELSLQSIPLKYNCINESIDHFSKRGKLSFCDRNPLKTMIYHSMVQTKKLYYTSAILGSCRNREPNKCSCSIVTDHTLNNGILYVSFQFSAELVEISQPNNWSLD